MIESARPASRRDAPRLAELWDAADEEIGVQRGGARLVGAGARPRGLAPTAGDDADLPLHDDPDRLVLVGCIDDVVVGFACASIDRRAARPVAVVDGIFVEREARAVGVGEALCDEVVGWADAAGCTGVDAYALPGNRAAKAFFEDAGFVTRLLTMHRPIPAPRA